MSQLCQITDIEKYLLTNYPGNPSDLSDEEERVEYIIDAVSAEIETICNRKFLLDSYNEFYSGNGSSSLFLNQYPIQSISSITMGSCFGTNVSRSTVESTSYIINTDTGEVVFNFESIEYPALFNVVYSAGYVEVPYDLSLIAVQECVRVLNGTEQDTNLKSEKLGDAQNTYFSSAENKNNLRNKLANYIRNDI